MVTKIESNPKAGTPHGSEVAISATSSLAKPPRTRRMARNCAAPELASISSDTDKTEHPSPAAPVAPRPASKSAQVVALLERAEGATLTELVAATGWLPHTTRAALTGLRKKGYPIVKNKRGEVTCYRIASAG